MAAMWRFELANSAKIVVAGSLREDDKNTKAGMRGKVEIRWLNIAILDKIEWV